MQALIEATQKQSAAELQSLTTQMETCGMLEALEDLQQHPSQKVYEIAVKILEDFFEAGDEEEANPSTRE